MEPIVRQRVIAAGSLALALLAGWQIAEGSYGLAACLAGTGALFALQYILEPVPDAMLAGMVIVGYLVGNRGFAQLHPANLPLLPAETVLLVAIPCLFWRSAFARRLPFRTDALNIAILLWIVLSSIRLPFDTRAYGFMALRDFAMVYYAAFFYLGQAWSATEANRRFLRRCLTTGLAIGAPVFCLFTVRPDWFISHLTIGGVPLIYIKSDVAGAFMAAGVFWFAGNVQNTRNIRSIAPMTLCLFAVGISNSRAAAVAVVAGLGWLVVLRHWRTLQVFGAILGIVLCAMLAHAVITPKPIATTPLYRLYEASLSVLDYTGSQTYQSADLGDKPDNNQFRLVWWKSVIDETREENPWLGLGFGRDIAAQFLRIYYPEGDEEFTARSPHNFVLSTFARTGVIGLSSFAFCLMAIARATWKSSRVSADQGKHDVPQYWLASWAIFVSACFGVVLEGPMGAVVFWTLLGIANADTLAGTLATGSPNN